MLGNCDGTGTVLGTESISWNQTCRSNRSIDRVIIITGGRRWYSSRPCILLSLAHAKVIKTDEPWPQRMHKIEMCYFLVAVGLVFPVLINEIVICGKLWFASPACGGHCPSIQVPSPSSSSTGMHVQRTRHTTLYFSGLRSSLFLANFAHSLPWPLMSELQRKVFMSSNVMGQSSSSLVKNLIDWFDLRRHNSVMIWGCKHYVRE